MKSTFYCAITLQRALAGSLLLLAAYGCSSQGSEFGKSGSATGSGGGATVGSGTSSSSGTSTGGSTTGTGGSDTTGAGGNGSVTSSTATGAGGSNPTGAGSTTTGAGGTGPTGAGGSGTGGAGGAGTGGSGGSLPACPKPAGQLCHEFIANDNANFKINYVNEFTSTNPGGVVWSVAVGDDTVNSPRTIEIVDNAKAKNGKAVLVSVNKGFAEFDLTDGTNLARVANTINVTGACRIPDGNTALAIYPNIKIVSPTGAAVRQFALPVGDNLRAINRNPSDGTFWLSLTESIFEVSDQGQQIWKGNMGAGTKGYAVWWRAGGGAYATTGEPATVVEINAAGTILATIGGRTLFPDLDFFSGFQRLPNGNYIVANWLGHVTTPASNRPHVVELTPQNTMPWTWGNQTLARQITNVFVFR